MSTDYFSDYQSYIASRTLPSPADTPYHTPSPELSRSRRSSNRRTPRNVSSSPQPPPPDAQEGNAYGLDPKRFTPTLHASLVSEILTLRRELDTKHRAIEDLESSLESAKTENEGLADRLAQNAANSKQAEQRFRHLEDNTLDAVEELVRQRDRVDSANEELRSKLEALNKRIRKQEEEHVLSHDSWERERQTLENERQQLERRVHVTENRLRTVVEEISLRQSAAEDRVAEAESEPEDTFRDSAFGNDSDAASIRSHRIARHSRNRSSISVVSRRSLSSPSKHNRTGGAKNVSLADELEFDEEEEMDLDEPEQDDDNGLFSDEQIGIMSEPHSQILNRSPSKAKRVLGLTGPASGASANTDLKEPLEAPREIRRSTSIPELAARMGLNLAKAAYKYVDTGVQSSRSPSPARLPAQQEKVAVSQPLDTLADTTVEDPSMKMSKDDSIQPRLHAQKLHMEPLSPPETPGLQSSSMKDHLAISPQEHKAYRSSSTQTNSPSPLSGPIDLALRRHAPVDDVQIPSIAIHPPGSQPVSPGEAVLPPGMVNASVQTGVDLNKNVHDASAQTEEIRIDQRPVKLPPHLLPSAVHEVRAELVATADSMDTMPFVEQRQASTEDRKAFFEAGTNALDPNGKPSRAMPLKAIALPRPILLAAAREEERQKERELEKQIRHNQPSTTRKFSSASHFQEMSDESDHFDEVPSDVDPRDVFGTTPGMFRPFMRSGLSGLPKTVPEDREISPLHDVKSQSGFTSRRDSGSTAPSTRPMSGSNRASSSRASRAGTSHRSRSPSLTSVGSEGRPPFPIPTRSSSRTPSQVPSEEPSSPTPYSTNPLHSLHSERGPQYPRRIGLRKVKSSNTMKHNVRMSPRRRRRSPQLTPIQSMAFDGSPSKFQLSDFIQAEDESIAVHQDHSQVEARNAVLSSETAVEDDAFDTSLVDSIAATMVGEWMWKYVRRRKSFGIGESGQDLTKMADDGGIGGSGTRHKRWVWLSPYERTVMWSAKQPNSGSALLGKGGRKREYLVQSVRVVKEADQAQTVLIKSVLDVKDNTPLPKSAASSESIFDRSILILTPERALKFTASNRERHYLWLTALSFLAQSGRGPPAIPRVPVAKEPSSTQTRVPAARQGSLQHSAVPGNPRSRPAPISVSSSYTEPSQSGSVVSPSDTIPTPHSAAPPSISRLRAPYQRHQRKRSNTNPQLPTPLSGLRSFSSTAITSTMMSAARDGGSSNASSYRQPMTSHSSSRSSRRTSVASPEQPNFFEAMGTIRMEAFVDPSMHDGVLYVPAPAPSALVGPGRGHRRSRNNSTFSAATNATEERRVAGYVFDEHGNDPFKGF
ncbi:hypothetical protein MBLNU459_g4484t1 [Dothideomycetes sp. NU459]